MFVGWHLMAEKGYIIVWPSVYFLHIFFLLRNNSCLQNVLLSYVAADNKFAASQP